MKHLFLVLLFVSSLLSFEWADDYDEALVQAKKENKIVYVFIGTANCPFCNKLKETTLSEKEVMEKLNEGFVPIYLSVDIDDIPEQFNLRFYPAHYFIDKNGKMIYSTAGYRKKSTFLELLSDVKKM